MDALETLAVQRGTGFRQEITKQYVGIEEERRALEEMTKAFYEGKIDTCVLLVETVNIKAGLIGIA